MQRQPFRSATPRPGPAQAADVVARQKVALPVFVVLCFGWSWALWIAGSALKLGSPGLGTAFLLAAGFGPSFAGIFTVWAFAGGAGLRRWLRRCLRWRFNPGWYAVALLSPLVAMMLAVGVDAALNGVWPASPAAGHVGRSLLQSSLILFIGGPLGEEFGWRGYVLPALTARLGWRWAGLAVGAIWGLWHLPLFFLPGMAQAQMPIFVFMASALALSVVMARMTVNTGWSVLPALLFHWAINAGPALIPTIPTGGNVRAYVVATGLLFIAAAGCGFRGDRAQPVSPALP